MEYDFLAKDTTAIQDIYRQDLSEVPSFLQKVFCGQSAQEIVRPVSVEAVSQLLARAREEQKPVTPRAMASWAFGGVIPMKQGYILDLKSLNQIESIDSDKKQVVVEAGVTWDDLSRAIEPKGLDLYTVPTSRFSTVGGWISTGGYGINSYKFGHLSSYIIWLEVVTPNGQIKKLSPDAREFKYFIGTEGQMGVITRICLKVRSRPARQKIHLIYASSIEEIMKILGECKQKNIKPVSARYLGPAALHHFNELLGEPLLQTTHALLITIENDSSDNKSSTQTFPDEAPAYLARYLWHERFFPMKAKRLSRGLLAAEVILPADQLDAYLTRVENVTRSMGTSLAHEVHFLNGGREAQAISLMLCDRTKTIPYLDHLVVVMMLTRLGEKYRGRAYGVGLWNIPFKKSILPAAELSFYEFYKKQVDPLNLMNPGKGFSDACRGWLARWSTNPRLLKLGLDIFIKINSFLNKLSFGKKKTVVFESHAARLMPPLELREDQLAESIYTCARCGSCLAVCPAYRVTGNESVSPRGKLILAEKLLSGNTLTDAEAQNIFTCMHCRACEEVCQTELALVETWDKLEELVTKKCGRPRKLIEEFVNKIESDEKYKQLIDNNY